MALCNSCEAFDLLSFGQDPFNSRGYELRRLIISANEGCDFCTFLYDNVRDEIMEAQKLYDETDCWLHLVMSKDYQAVSPNAPFPVLPLSKRRSGLQFNKLFVILGPRHFRLGRGFLKCLRSRWEFCVLADPGSAAAKESDVTGRYLGRNPASNDHFGRIKHWLEECIQMHPKCNETASGILIADTADALLPSRCIEIGDRRLTLRNTKKGETGRYAIVSHRWDQDTESSMTTLHNFEARSVNLLLKDLPDTYRDAVSICKRLNISYLWIDSICIIQGNEEEWKREAPRMHDYYQKAVFTISADGASSGTRGCLFERQSAITGRLARLPYRDEHHIQRGHIYIFRRSQTLRQEYMTSVQDCPLQKRAWVLQERILSRRIIHYTGTKLYFECATCLPKNECGEEVSLEPFSEHERTDLALKVDFHYSTTLINDLWYRLVEVYSGLAISKPETDRLVAALGLAQVFQDMLWKKGLVVDPSSGVTCSTNGTPGYAAAGLWRQDLCHGLLWQQKEHTGIIKLSNCEAPTWSWASYMMPVKWHNRQDATTEACQIAAVETHACFVLSCAGKPVFNYPVYTSRHEISIQELEALWRRTEPRHPAGVLTAVRKSIQVLRITGKLKKVLVDRSFPDDDTLEEILESTGHPSFCAAELCRYIQGTWKGHYDIGWGSIERMMVENNPCIRPYREDDDMYAFHVSTLEGVSGGVEYGKLSWTHSVYNVLFLKRIVGMRFERVGVGRLFEQDYFEGVRDREFELV